LLETLPEENKLTFNKELIEKKYQEHQNVSCNDENSYLRLAKDIENRKLLLIGPGASIINEYDSIVSYIDKYKPVVISINFINDLYPIDYVFMGNSKRYSQFFHRIYGDGINVKVICTSNVSPSSKQIDYIFNYGALTNDTESVRDNPLLMVMKILKKMRL